jgi:hypothetical protein
MIKIDLITGFLGAGKTTFLKKYATYLIDNGYKICILENDFGAINVDMMLLDNLSCDKEMVSGACDYDCHFRRFKTKLISMALRGYDRVIVEPSGLFHTDEFFDALYEEPLNNFYEIGNIFTIYDINTKNLSLEAKCFIASMLAVAGKIIITKNFNNEVIDVGLFNNILLEFDSNRLINKDDIVYSSNLDIKSIINSGYVEASTKKISDLSNKYDSIYYLDLDYNLSKMKEKSDILFNDLKYGEIERIKGFILDNNIWYRINETKDASDISKIDNGQNVFIIIGNNLNKDLIDSLINN